MMARSKRTKESSTEFWLHEAEEIPRGDVGQVDKSAGRVKFYRWWVAGSVILLPISMLAVVSFIPAVLEEDPVPKVIEHQLDSPTKPVAMLAVQNWLNQDPSPLPGGEILSWDGVEIQAEPSAKTDPNTGEVLEVQGLQLHSMTVATDNGTIFDTRVQVGYSDIRGAQIIGEPTLIPRAPDDESTWPNLSPWPDLVPASTTDGIDQAAEAWVTAFTSGDPDTLRLAVGDTKENRSYVPLVQVTASEVMVGDVAAKAPAEDVDADAEPKTVVAQVSFGVVWDGQDIDEGATPARVSYDVLIERADTASPVVVAWGGPGTGQELKPYMNVVKGRVITSDVIEDTIGDPEALSEVPAGDEETETTESDES